MDSGALRTLGSRAIVSFLRISTRTVPIPGWFPLVVEQVHPHVTRESSIVEVELAGVRMRVDVDEYTQRRIFYGAYEPGEVAILKRLLRPGDIALDVGAHVGFFTLLAAAAVGDSGEVHAFEPAPSNYQALTENVALNGFRNVVPNNVAVADEAGSVELGRTGGTNTGAYTQGGKQGSFTVQTVALDQYATEQIGDRPLRLFKIDVEGVEPQVMSGFRLRLRAQPPDALLIEVNVDMLAFHGYRAHDITEPLIAAGYGLYRIGARRLTPLAGDELDFSPRPPATGPTRGTISVVKQGLRERRTFFNLLAVQDGVLQPGRATRS